MPEQQRLFGFDTAPPDVPPLKSHQTASREIVSGPEGDFVLYHVRNDYVGMSNAHKADFLKKADSVGSAYEDLVPNIGSLPKPGESFPNTRAEREEIYREGTIPEVLPYMAGVRLALAERRSRRQHRVAQSALRRVHVAHNVADHVVRGKGRHLAPENEFRPKTLRPFAKCFIFHFFR